MKPIKPSDLKIRASAFANIVKLDRASQLTANQAKELDGLLSKVQLTEAQCKKRDYLISKRDAPDQLSRGAKTYIQDVFFGHVSEFQKQFTNKFTQKGNDLEAKAIAEVCKYLGLPVVTKNEKHFEGDYTTGTPDTILKPFNFQLDVKNVYYPNGLDTFDEVDDIYEWQAHVYNDLCNVENGFVVKLLQNPTEALLEKESWTMAKEAGVEFITDDFKQEVRDYFDFESRMSIGERIKIYHVKTEQKHRDMIKKCTLLAREYYAELTDQWNSKNKQEVELIKTLRS